MNSWQQLVVWSIFCRLLMLIVSSSALRTSGLPRHGRVEDLNSFRLPSHTKGFSKKQSDALEYDYKHVGRAIATENSALGAVMTSQYPNDRLQHNVWIAPRSARTYITRSLQARQPHSAVSLDIVYHFYCEHAGSSAVQFGVIASFYGLDVSGDYILHFRNRANIHNLKTVRYDRRIPNRPFPVDFKTSFESHFCYPLGLKMCLYAFIGHFEGVLWLNHMRLTFITDIHNHEYRPKVTETCIDIHGRGVCPALAVQQDECFMRGVSVNIAY